MTLETPTELADRLRLGREEFVQRLLTTLILDARYPRWNSRSSVSEDGLRFLRALWELSELGPWPDANPVLVDEFELPGRHDDETGGAPDYAVVWPSWLWMIELKTEARSHRRAQLRLYFDLAHHHHRGMPIDLTYLTPPLRSTYEHDGPGRYAHVTWEQVAPRLADCWSHAERPDQVAIRDGLLDAIARLHSDTPGDYLASLRTQRPPAPAARPDPAELGLQLAAATADDREQRALEYAAASLEELQELRKQLRDELANREGGSPLLHVRPWIWTHKTDGSPMTAAGAETRRTSFFALPQSAVLKRGGSGAGNGKRAPEARCHRIAFRDRERGRGSNDRGRGFPRWRRPSFHRPCDATSRRRRRTREGPLVTLRVVSWNIDARGDGLEERIDRLANFDADILLLQEVPRRVAALLSTVSRVSWAQLSTLYSEPTGGSSARLGTAILAGERVQLRAVGQIPAQRFIDAGVRAGLSESEVRERTGWLHRNLYADVEVDGLPLRVCSLHARPATGGRPGRPPLGYTRQVFHRVCATWMAEHSGSALFGIDANGPFADHPERNRWQPAMAGDAALIGPDPEHHLTDALYRWLASRPDELQAIRQSRPDGPLAVSYLTSGSKRPCRYDHLYVTADIDVQDIQYRPPHSDGSDHGAVVTTLTSRQP